MFDPNDFLDSFKEFVQYVSGNFLRAIFGSLLLLAVFGGFTLIYDATPLFVKHVLNDSIEKAATSYTLINKVLTQERDDAHTSRTMLFQFHDSKKDMLGTDFFFVSATNAVGGPGVVLDIASLQNIPASSYIEAVNGTSVLNELVHHHPIYFKVVDMSDGYLKEMMQARGTKFALWSGIYDLDGNIVGFITEAWFDLDDVPQGVDMDSHLSRLKSDGDRISGFLLNRIGY